MYDSLKIILKETKREHFLHTFDKFIVICLTSSGNYLIHIPIKQTTGKSYRWKKHSYETSLQGYHYIKIFSFFSWRVYFCVVYDRKSKHEKTPSLAKKRKQISHKLHHFSSSMRSLTIISKLLMLGLNLNVCMI